MSLFPVLHDHDAGDGDRHQHGKRSGDVKRNAEGKEWNRNQSLAKAERRSNRRSDEHDE